MPKKKLLSIELTVVLIGLAIYIPYADRRTPVEPQSGEKISWAKGAYPTTKARCRVATYNICRGKGTDDIRDLNRTAAVLVNMDVMGLNEVAGPTLFSNADQAEQLGEILQTGWLFAPNQRRWHRYHFGNALLSQLPVKEWHNEPLVYDKKQSQSHRNLLHAQILIDNQPVAVFITHLDRGAIRQTQLQFVLQLFSRHTPAILLGDLNSQENDPVLAGFLSDANNVDALEVALGDRDPESRIDWIFTRGLTVLTGGVHPTGASDHPCYWVDITLSDPNQ